MKRVLEFDPGLALLPPEIHAIIKSACLIVDTQPDASDLQAIRINSHLTSGELAAIQRPATDFSSCIPFPKGTPK